MCTAVERGKLAEPSIYMSMAVLPEARKDTVGTRTDSKDIETP